MTQTQMVIKYVAIAFAIVLIISIISGIVVAVSRLAAPRDEQTGEMRDLPIGGAVDSLRIDVEAVDLILQAGSSLSVESNNSRVSATVKNGTLHIEESSSWLHTQTVESTLILTIPADQTFRAVDIDAGAGRIAVDNLVTERLELDLGAGDVEIKELTVQHVAEINGGAGRITVNGGAIHDLDFDAGVGEVNICAALTGDSEINMGVGKVTVHLLGTESDYTVAIDKGIGSATFNGKEMDSGARYGSGVNHLDVDGGIGEIQIRTASESD